MGPMELPPQPTPVQSQKPPREKSSAQLLAESPEIFDCLFLVKNGVPFDVAFSLPDDERLAWVVVMGQLSGMTWNWDSMSWEKPR